MVYELKKGETWDSGITRKLNSWGIPITMDMGIMIRVLLGVAFFCCTETPFHESGHIFVALMQGRQVYAAKMFGLGWVSATAYNDVPSDILFYLGGIATTPIYMFIYKNVFNGFYPFEKIILWTSMIAGFITWDGYIILQLILLR